MRSRDEHGIDASGIRQSRAHFELAALATVLVEATAMITHFHVMAADGVRLHAAAMGNPDAPLMLFLHGFPEFWQAWHRQLAEFGRDHYAVALDLRGYNVSDKPPGKASYALPKIVKDIRAVLGALSPHRPAIVVGHDWGGIAAWALATQSPALLERMVIINAPHPAIFLRELTRNPAQQIASSYAGLFQLRGVAEATLRAFDYAALRKMVFGITAKPRMFSPALRKSYREAWAKPGALEASLNYYRNVAALKRVAAQSTARIDVPTLVLWGEKDPALLPANLVGLDRLVKDLTVRRRAGATHWIVHEEPVWVNAAIRRFITPVSRAGRRAKRAKPPG
jgi:epoxide hydrolase 4